jgi:maleate cis-trans isomerase
VGVLYPGFAAEDDYPHLERLLGVRLPVVHTAIDSDAHTLASLRDMGAAWRLADGVERLRPLGAAAVMWACTSGSFVLGWDGARAQADRVAAAAGVPASSTSLAFVEAARALAARRVAVAATYPAEVAGCFVDFLQAAGLEVAHHASRGIFTATEVGNLGREEVGAFVEGLAAAGADALLVPDTALRTAAVLEDLERRAGMPVLTANQVTAWEGLRLAGDTRPRRGAGRLFLQEDSAP